MSREKELRRMMDEAQTEIELLLVKQIVSYELALEEHRSVVEKLRAHIAKHGLELDDELSTALATLDEHNQSAE